MSGSNITSIWGKIVYMGMAILCVVDQLCNQVIV
jgi:hypothetical protein